VRAGRQRVKPRGAQLTLQAALPQAVDQEVPGLAAGPGAGVFPRWTWGVSLPGRGAPRWLRCMGDGSLRTSKKASRDHDPEPNEDHHRTGPRQCCCVAEDVMPIISAPHEFNEDELYIDLRSMFGQSLFLKC